MIEVKHIRKKYGKKIVLDDICFQVTSGQRIAIVGKNGCGKTTLMQIMAGVIKPSGGTISYYGKSPLEDKKYFRKYCGYVPQENPLIEELTVRDNLRLWGADKAAGYKQLVEMFQLEPIMKMVVKEMSGGMKRRLSIACALAEWPPVFILDEPTAALDMYYKESIRTWMQEYKKMNGIIIMTTHDENEILDSDRCLIMKNGHLEEVKKDEKMIDSIKSYIQTS